MRVLITGICGFVGSALARALLQSNAYTIYGIDNFSRSGSWLNKEELNKLGIKIFHGDIRLESDLETLPKVDWVIDAAANPSVLAGIDGKSSSAQLVQYNLLGTINLLEYCKRNKAGFILLSTSRVYSIPPLVNLNMEIKDKAFAPVLSQEFPHGVGPDGVKEYYTSEAPISLYGSTKLASEQLALEYGLTFNFPVWINRCGVLAGAGQFGHPGQGIFAYWIHSFKEKKPLKYIGFGGTGYQVRDCLHPRDLVPLLIKQFNEPLDSDKRRIVNLSGGVENSMSLARLTEWCRSEIGETDVISTNTERPFDIPWMVLDSRLAEAIWGWKVQTPIHEILGEIAHFASDKENWCDISNS